MLALGNG